MRYPLARRCSSSLLPLVSACLLGGLSLLSCETSDPDDLVYEDYCTSQEGDEARLFGVVSVAAENEFDIDSDVVPGAIVKMVREVEGSPKGEDVLATEADEFGEFAACLPPGQYRIVASYTGHENLEYNDCDQTGCAAQSCGGHYLSANVPEENDEFIELSAGDDVEQDVQLQLVFVTG